MDKVRCLRNSFPALDIQVDGGLNEETTKIAAKAGANIIVAGSAIFKNENPKDVIASMRASVQAAL